MCSAGGVGALSAVQSVFSQRGAAESAYNQEMAAYQRAMANWEIDKKQAQDRQNMLSANAILQLQQIQNAQQEVNDAAVEQKSEIARELMKAREMAKLSAGEANVSGNAVDRIMSDLGFTEQSKLAAVEATRQNQVLQLQAEKMNAKQSAAVAPIYAAIGPPPEKDDGFSSILSAAISGLGSFTGLSKTSTGSAPRTATCGTTTPVKRYGG